MFRGEALTTETATETATETLTPEAVNETLFKQVGFTPWPEQAHILKNLKRFSIVLGGDQGGKSLVISKGFLIHYYNDLANLTDPETPLLYWLVAADYERTRAEFEYIADDLTTLYGIGSVFPSKRLDPGNIEVYIGPRTKLSKPHLRVETKSAKDPRTLAMKGPDGIIGCEASQLDVETFYRILSRAGPKRGWVLLSGTFEREMGVWYGDIADTWGHVPDTASFSLPSYTNRSLYPGGRNDPEILRIERESPDDFFMERIEGKRVPPRGLVFAGAFSAGVHIKDVRYRPGHLVHVWSDPGYDGACAVHAAHYIDGQIQVFDEIYQTGLVTEQIIDIARQRPWWKEEKRGVVDVAGLQHQSMPAVAEVWLKYGGLYMHANRVLINEGTDRLKTFLKPNPVTHQPAIVYSPECKGVLSEYGVGLSPISKRMEVYRWELGRDGSVVGKTPRDKYNHAIKADIYGIVSVFGHARSEGSKIIKVQRW